MWILPRFSPLWQQQKDYGDVCRRHPELIDILMTKLIIGEHNRQIEHLVAGLIFQCVQNQITCSLSLVSLHFSTAWTCKVMKCVWAALILHHVWTMLCYLLMDCKTFSICLHLPQNSDEYKTRSKQQRWRSLARSLSRCDGLQTDFTERTEEKIPSVRSQITSWVILCRKQRSHHPNAINAFYEIKH